MFVKPENRFHLNDYTRSMILDMEPKFGYDGFGEICFYRTYSLPKEDGSAETFNDVLLRVTDGTFSIRKDWYKKNHIYWDEKYWQDYAKKVILAAFKMHWLPPGRGLFKMGTDFVYERGSMALYNCSYTHLTSDNLDEDIAWAMDCLMLGVGVGGWPIRNDKFKLHKPVGEFDFVIPDSREGWAESTRLLINAYIRPNQRKPRLIYDLIREKGTPIKGFGGTCSGPEPLIKYHEQIVNEVENYKDVVLFKANLLNQAGCCVVAGNVRRSAEDLKGSPQDEVFLNLKDYNKYPERGEYGWMSNNTVALLDDEDFDRLGEIAKRVKFNGEPGYLNLRNFPKARIGKKDKYRRDRGDGINPCGEILLEHREVCNIDETFPTVCEIPEEWYEACELATFYCSTVTLLPTHQPSTNKVVARNRRIGVGLVDYVGWTHQEGVHKVTKYLRNGYKIIRKINKQLNEEAGIPVSLRVTTVKPGGTIPKLPGKTSGAGYPTFKYTIRRINIADNSPLVPLFIEANIPYETSVYGANTLVFEYPIIQGYNEKTKTYCKFAEDVTIWEQAFNIITLQREWSDNAVSNTLYFRPMWALCEQIYDDHAITLGSSYIGITEAYSFLASNETEYIIPEKYKFVKINNGNKVEIIKVFEYDPKHEENDIEPVLSAIAPLTKTISVLPHTANGVYKQMPEEGISLKEYEERRSKIQKINWSNLKNHYGEDEKYCSGSSCEIKKESN